MTPQIIYILLISVSLLLNANLHGKSKEGKHNFWIHLIATVTTSFLLYWGGFFDNIIN